MRALQSLANLKSLNNKKQVKKLLFLGILLTFSVFIIFMIYQLILPVLLTPTNYCFQDEVTSPSDWLDMVYSDFLWSPPDNVLVLILDSRKYGHHQIYLYRLGLRVSWTKGNRSSHPVIHKQTNACWIILRSQMATSKSTESENYEAFIMIFYYHFINEVMFWLEGETKLNFTNWGAGGIE